MKKSAVLVLGLLFIGLLSCRDQKKEEEVLNKKLDKIESVEKQVDEAVEELDQKSKEVEEALSELDSI